MQEGNVSKSEKNAEGVVTARLGCGGGGRKGGRRRKEMEEEDVPVL